MSGPAAAAAAHHEPPSPAPCDLEPAANILLLLLRKFAPFISLASFCLMITNFYYYGHASNFDDCAKISTAVLAFGIIFALQFFFAALITLNQVLLANGAVQSEMLALFIPLTLAGIAWLVHGTTSTIHLTAERARWCRRNAHQHKQLFDMCMADVALTFLSYWFLVYLSCGIIGVKPPVRSHARPPARVFNTDGMIMGGPGLPQQHFNTGIGVAGSPNYNPNLVVHGTTPTSGDGGAAGADGGSTPMVYDADGVPVVALGAGVSMGMGLHGSSTTGFHYGHAVGSSERAAAGSPHGYSSAPQHAHVHAQAIDAENTGIVTKGGGRVEGF